MSTRYVWGEYSKKSVYKEERSKTSYFTFQSAFVPVTVASSYSFSKEYGTFSPAGNTATLGIELGSNNTISAVSYPFLFVHNTAMYRNGTVTSGDYWQLSHDTVSTTKCVLANGSITKMMESYTVQSAYEAGAFREYKASQSSSAYPSDGESGSYWYIYAGSDTIDPTSVRYSKSDLQAGESVTIQVSPRTPTYGGTISYQYQYSTNGGSSWTNIGSKTTNTSVSVTIPEGAKQFKARVRASDNYGFTSSDYVTGPALGVSVLKAYVGINTKARAVSKIYVGVNGKAREVVKGYIGVGGKARKFL